MSSPRVSVRVVFASLSNVSSNGSSDALFSSETGVSSDAKRHRAPFVSSALRSTRATRAGPSHTYTTLSARPYPARIASGRQPCFANTRAKSACVSGCARSEAFKHERMRERFNARGRGSPSDAFFSLTTERVAPKRAAHSLYAKSGPCVMVAPYSLATRIHDAGSRANATGE